MYLNAHDPVGTFGSDPVEHARQNVERRGHKLAPFGDETNSYKPYADRRAYCHNCNQLVAKIGRNTIHNVTAYVDYTLEACPNAKEQSHD